MQNKKVLLGMSGGVDSSVSAILLKEEGYEVIGATMELWQNNKNIDNGGCGSNLAVNDAKKVCEELGIKHYTLDLKKEFNECVIKDFIQCYKNAITPNPCIECNKHLKFNYFYKKAMELGCEYIATGHYAKIEYSDKYGQYVLKKSKSINKDQSYVLYNMPREIMQHVLFPLSDFENKEQIRKIAEEHNLNVAKKPDSQEICFIPDNNYNKFLLEHLKEKQLPGNIIDKQGRILGKHTGLINYTVGQRKGLGISSKEPLYVIRLDKEKNSLVVGAEADIYSKILYANNVNYVLDVDLKESMCVKAKIRYSAKEAEAILTPIEGKCRSVKLEFKEPQRAITKGQSVVFYLNDIVMRWRKNYLGGIQMKTERGVTLVSLGIYLVVFLIALVTLTTITTYFQNNVGQFNTKNTENLEFEKFNLYFIEEVKKTNNGINEEESTDKKIIFSEGNKYEFKDNAIILNDNLKVAENISNCTFSYIKDTNDRQIVTVYMKIGETERANEYILNNQRIENIDNEDYIYGYKRAEGTNSVELENAIETNLKDYKIYGNSIQKGTTTTSGLLEIESVGDKTKNLFNPEQWSTSTTQNGITLYYLKDEDCFVLNGTAESSYGIFIKDISIVAEIGKSYTLSNQYVSGIMDKSACESEKSAVTYISKNDTLEGRTNWLNTDLTTNTTQSYKTGVCDVQYITKFWFYISKGVSFNNYKVKVQLQQSNTVTPYEPYGYKIPVMVTGKNLLPYPYYDTTKTESGVTFTDNGDGSITVNGDATDYSAFTFIRYEDITKYIGQSLTFSLNSENVSNMAGQIMITDADNNIVFNKTTTSDSSFVVPNTAVAITLLIKRNNNGEVSGTFKPQLELENKATAYEKYIPSEKTNIYLEEPLRKIGEYADYIDFANQKLVRQVQVVNNAEALAIGEILQGTDDPVETKISLPNIGIIENSAKITIGTKLAPSKISILYYAN